MAENERARAARVLRAVRSLPPGVLDAAAAHAPTSSAALIQAIQSALRAPDPEAALAAALRGIERDGGDAALVAARPSLVAASALAREASPVRAQLTDILDGQHALAARATALRDDLAVDYPALSALVGDALPLLGDDGPFRALKEALASVGELERSLGDLSNAIVDPMALRGSVDRLRAQRDAIAAVGAELARVPELVARARDHAELRGDTAAVAQLAAVDAALRDREPGADARWWAAFELAATTDQLGLARHLGERIKLTAARDGAVEPVIAVAARLAELAAHSRDVDAELAAYGDQALAFAQVPGGADRAQAFVMRAQLLAGAAPIRAVRARLLEGLVLERLGDAQGARIAFRDIMARARDLDGIGHELGWAALHLGRLEGAIGQAFRAGQDLELAQQIGAASGDLTLFALAASARIELAPDREHAEAILGTTDAAPPELRGELRRRVDVRWPSH